jgi:hypothetical protein
MPMLVLGQIRPLVPLPTRLLLLKLIPLFSPLAFLTKIS